MFTSSQLTRGVLKCTINKIVFNISGDSMDLLKDKVALITGAGGGIGRGVARCFAREGACLLYTSDAADE